MESRYHYSSVTKSLEELYAMGYLTDFNLHEENIINNPENYKIAHIYRYEGDTNPDDEATVFGIECTSGEKGVFVTGYAANSMSDAAKILHEISIKGRN
jgi:hypothetical protein